MGVNGKGYDGVLLCEYVNKRVCVCVWVVGEEEKGSKSNGVHGDMCVYRMCLI